MRWAWFMEHLGSGQMECTGLSPLSATSLAIAKRSRPDIICLLPSCRTWMVLKPFADNKSDQKSASIPVISIDRAWAAQRHCGGPFEGRWLWIPDETDFNPMSCRSHCECIFSNADVWQQRPVCSRQHGSVFDDTTSSGCRDDSLGADAQTYALLASSTSSKHAKAVENGITDTALVGSTRRWETCWN